MLFGLLEKEQFGYCDDVDEYPYRYRRRGRSGGGGGGGGDENWHPFIDTSHTTISIKKLVTTDGSTLRRNMKVSKKDLQANLIHDQEDPFRKAERGERNYSGFTGNEGVSATHWYRVTVAVIIPKDDVDQFLIKGLNNNEAQARLPQYLEKCSAPETRELGMKVVRQLARTAWSRDPLYGFYFGRSSSDPLNIEIALKFVATILKYREYDLFNKALGWFKTKVGAELFAHVKEAAAAPSFKFRKIKDSLLHNLSLRSVDQQMQLLTVLGLPTDASYNPKIGEWAAHEVVPIALAACQAPQVSLETGIVIVNMIKEYGDVAILQTGLVPIIQQQISLTPFALAALTRILHFAAEGVFDKAVTLALCKPLLEAAFDNMDLASLRTQGGVEASVRDARTLMDWREREAFSRDGPHKHPEMIITPNLLAKSLASCIPLNWRNLTRRFCFQITHQIANVPLVEFQYLWIPFVHKLIRTLDAAHVPLSTPRYQNLARIILNSYLVYQVGMEPSGALDYGNQGQVTCTSCNDCRSLNYYLASGDRVWELRGSQSRRGHIERQLGRFPRSQFTLEIERNGGPHTLVVTKNVDTGAKAKAEWTERFAQAWDLFGKFDEEKLKRLLGSSWERITSMRHLRLDHGPAGGVNMRRVPVVGSGSGGRVAGVKRRADD